MIKVILDPLDYYCYLGGNREEVRDEAMKVHEELRFWREKSSKLFPVLQQLGYIFWDYRGEYLLI